MVKGVDLALRGQHRCADQRQVNTVQPAKHAPCMRILSITITLLLVIFGSSDESWCRYNTAVMTCWRAKTKRAKPYTSRRARRLTPQVLDHIHDVIQSIRYSFQMLIVRHLLAML